MVKIMKIGILTFHKAINYGSVLQTWSLQEFLKSEGHDVEIIDYEPGAWKSIYGTFNKIKGFTNLKRNLKLLPLSYFYIKKSKNFENFRNEYLNLSVNKYYIGSDFSSFSEKYDCIICGSDQIWNIKIADCDPIYFLPNLKIKKKIAYAVSVGNSDFVDIDNSEQLKKWILDFDHITVREQKTIEKLCNFTKINVATYCALDPTLLHTKEVFDKIISKRIVKEDYIFLYNIWNDNDGFRIAKEISKQKGLPVYTVLSVRNLRLAIRIKNNNIKILFIKSSPSHYLSLIKHASFVITDSFHGTAFSVIFEKQFICVNYRKEDYSLKNDVRLNNILGYFNLQNRYMSVEQALKFDTNNNIDYEDVTPSRLRLAKESKDILIQQLK